MVVLVLDFKKGVIIVHVCAYTDFLPHLTACMMHAVHLIVIGVVICSVVTCNALAVNVLNVVFAMNGCKKPV